MANPTVYASPRQYIGLAVEQTQGTPVVPAVTMPVANFDPYDQPTWIDDPSVRGAIAGIFNRVEGPNHTEFDLGGPLYFDTAGYLFSNIFGDNTYSGTYTGSGTTTSTGTVSAGATTIPTAASISASTLIQIDTGVNAEVGVVLSVAGSFTLTMTTPLLKNHASGVAVKPITTPYSSQFALLNSGNGQPSSMTITDYQGPTASTGVRAYSGCCLSELDLSGTVDSSAITYTAKGMGWPSAQAAAFTSSPSSVTPQAAWETIVGLNGTAGGAQIKTVNEWGMTFSRALTIYNTAQNSQNPYVIFRDVLMISGTLNLVVSNDTYNTYLIGNTQPQLQIIVSNGLSGASLLSMQIDAQQCAFTTSKIARGNAAVEAAVTFDLIANSTNTGYSGLFGPATVTMQNAVTGNSY